MTHKNEPIDCSFLQVTINSNKLMQILQKQMKQINEHASQIKILRQVIPKIKQSVISSMQSTQARVKLQVQKSAMKTKQQLTLVKAQLESLDQQINKLTIHCEKKFKESQTKLLNLQQEKKKISATINMYQQNRINIQNKIQDQICTIQSTLKTRLDQFRQHTTKTQQKFQLMFIQIQSMGKKRNSKSKLSSTNIKHQNNSNATKTRISGFANTMTGWTNFNAKVTQDWKNKNKQLGLQTLQHQIQDDNSSVFTQVQAQNISFENFNSLYTICNKQNLKRFQGIKNKAVVQQQKLQIALRKLQKILQSQSQIKLNFKKIEEKKIQQQHLKLINNYVNQLKLQIQQDIDRKLHKETFERQKNKILQKISIIHQNLTQKAEKSDMKKAFLFVQQKIKQIIILIASDQNQQKDGAIKKIPIKCLSCDKGLQTQNQTPSRLASPALTSRQNQNSGIRAMTRKRQRINKTILQNFTNN